MRQPTRYRSHNIKAMRAPMKERARCCHADDREQTSRDFGSEEFTSDDDRQNSERNKKVGKVRMTDVLRGEQELRQEAASALLNTKHRVQFLAGHLHANAGQEADKNTT